MRKILEGTGAEEGKTTHVHLLRARCGTVGTDKHGAGAKTLRSPGSRPARDVEELVWTTRQMGRGTRQKKAKHVFRSWALLQIADELQVRRVRWYQSWARYPKDHHAVATAVLGTCKIDRVQCAGALNSIVQCLLVATGNRTCRCNQAFSSAHTHTHRLPTLCLAKQFLCASHNFGRVYLNWERPKTQQSLFFSVFLDILAAPTARRDED